MHAQIIDRNVTYTLRRWNDAVHHLNACQRAASIINVQRTLDNACIISDDQVTFPCDERLMIGQRDNLRTSSLINRSMLEWACVRSSNVNDLQLLGMTAIVLLNLSPLFLLVQ